MILVLLAACSSPDPKKIKVKPGHRAPACAGYTACINTPMSFSECVQFLDSIGYWDPSHTSLLMGFMGVGDKGWVNKLSLAQNAGCVARAGADCDAVLACLNQGETVRGCTSSDDYIRGSSCEGERILEGCTNTGIEGDNILTSVRCREIGLECIEVSLRPALGLLASCAHPEKYRVDGVEVTCDGTVANIRMDKASYRFDCAFAGAECHPDEYPDITGLLNAEFCQAGGPACGSDFVSYCEGNTLVSCIQGQEAHTDCALMGSICRLVEYSSGPGATCTYPHCDPDTYNESCAGGVITYCGREGVTTVSCTALGFSGCALDGTEAGCVL